jgi:AcrR family transcriptional regulator
MTDRGRETRARLIEAAIAVVHEVGYAHASTRAIARAAGVAEGTIYRHFPDKSALFFAAVMEANAPLVEWVSTLPERAGRSTVEENLTECLVRLTGLRDQLLPLELALAADPELSAQRRRSLAVEAEGRLPGPPEGIAAYLAAEQALGRVRADIDPRVTAIVLLSTLLGLAMIPDDGAAGMEVHLPSVIRLLLEGILPTGATAAPARPAVRAAPPRAGRA